MKKHFWKVRTFHKNNPDVPIDLTAGTRKEARLLKFHMKSLIFMQNVKMYKVIPFIYPNPLSNQPPFQCEYLQEVR